MDVEAVVVAAVKSRRILRVLGRGAVILIVVVAFFGFSAATLSSSSSSSCSSGSRPSSYSSIGAAAASAFSSEEMGRLPLATVTLFPAVRSVGDSARFVLRRSQLRVRPGEGIARSMARNEQADERLDT